MPSLVPRDHAEAVAPFRAQIIGALTRSELSHGELANEIRKLAERKYRPPGRRATKCFGASTLERWFYAYRRGGLAALRPDARSDRGRARELTPAQRELLLDARREHPGASAALILRTLVLDGRLTKAAVSISTVSRLFRDAKLPRGIRRDGHTRLRWQADHPGALWHGDVCHGPALRVGQTTKPLRIHALLDDASRFVVALEAHHTEREDDMLDLFVAALRRHGALAKHQLAGLAALDSMIEIAMHALVESYPEFCREPRITAPRKRAPLLSSSTSALRPSKRSVATGGSSLVTWPRRIETGRSDRRRPGDRCAAAD